MDSNWITMVLLIIVLLTILVTLVQGQPQYEVQLRGPIEFIYNTGFNNTLDDGTCCSLTEQGPPCNIACNNQITFCFREEQHPTSDTNLAVCPLGRMIFTPPTMNTDIITFNATIGTTTTTYPGSIQLLASIIALPQGNEVDSTQISLPREIQDRDSQLNTNGFTSVRTVVVTGGLRVVCKEGYFGPDCGCTPRDDSTGHFTCNEDGTIVCLPGYQNTDTNCVEEIITTSDPPTANTQTNAATTGDNTPPPTNPLSQTTPPPPTNPPSRTSPPPRTGPPEPTGQSSILPIAVGAGVGGLVVIAIIIVAIIVVALLCCPKQHKRSNNKEQEGVVLTTVKATSSEQSPEESGGVLYAKVNKENYSPQEEAPAITPYNGSIYTEVEKTGLFAGQSDQTTTDDDQLYSTVAQKDDTPQLVYADLRLSDVPRPKATSSNKQPAENMYDNINTTEVLYSHIQK